MASSRWKRFGFFDKQTINIVDVMEDLVAFDSNKQSLRSMVEHAELSQDALSFVMTSTTLDSAQTLFPAPPPKVVKDPSLIQLATAQLSAQPATQTTATTSATSSATATPSSDLILVYIASKDCRRVHCIDLTHADTAGWRGYISTNQPGVIDLAASTKRLACLHTTSICIYNKPHLHLTAARPYDESVRTKALATVTFDEGAVVPTTVATTDRIVAIGTKQGITYLYSIGTTSLKPFVKISPPPLNSTSIVALHLGEQFIHVGYSGGLCCFGLPNSSSGSSWAAPTGRHDLDSRPIPSGNVVDAQADGSVVVARSDGLYSYSQTERIGVAPIDGSKLTLSMVASYALVASTDSKSGRDAVDIYDSTNKLVAFHLLLSPGHRAVRACAGSIAAVLTSGGQVICFAEKSTQEKIALLVQKNLYSAAIVVGFSDSNYDKAEVTKLYQQHAEHLYRKGDFAGAMDQYIFTIGSLESSHVIFRFLDAPKIPFLVKYLEKLRSREMATSVHIELLRTCYLKLNDIQAAEAIAVSNSLSAADSSLDSFLSNLSSKPQDIMATICSLEAPQAAEAFVAHGATCVRASPKEAAGLVLSLVTGSYAPKKLATTIDFDSMIRPRENREEAGDTEPYPVALFASAFVEHPKLLRLILAHCNRNKCPITPTLRRTLLELTLSEWNQAKRMGDTETEKLRQKEAIALLTDSHCNEIGDYQALVIVQEEGFDEGELLLYERLQMVPMLLQRYSQDGTAKSRRQMLAMCQNDSEILADVLSDFVTMASNRWSGGIVEGKLTPDDFSDDDELEEIYDDIQELLALARRQKSLPPVRITRILAGEPPTQFSSSLPASAKEIKSIPLSIGLDYVGSLLEESRTKADQLEAEIEEYIKLCNSVEEEIESLESVANGISPSDDVTIDSVFDIDKLFTKAKLDDGQLEPTSAETREAFWRDLSQSGNTFETIAHFMMREGVI